jgi:hypothetical protein
MSRVMGGLPLGINAAPDRPFVAAYAWDSMGNSRVLPDQPHRNPGGEQTRIGRLFPRGSFADLRPIAPAASRPESGDSLPRTLRVLSDRRPPRPGPSAHVFVCSLARDAAPGWLAGCGRKSVENPSARSVCEWSKLRVRTGRPVSEWRERLSKTTGAAPCAPPRVFDAGVGRGLLDPVPGLER